MPRAISWHAVDTTFIYIINILLSQGQQVSAQTKFIILCLTVIGVNGKINNHDTFRIFNREIGIEDRIGFTALIM